MSLVSLYSVCCSWAVFVAWRFGVHQKEIFILQVLLVRKHSGMDSGKVFAMKILKKVRKTGFDLFCCFMR